LPSTLQTVCPQPSDSGKKSGVARSLRFTLILFGDTESFSLASTPKSFLSVVPQAGVEQLFMVFGVPKGHEQLWFSICPPFFHNAFANIQNDVIGFWEHIAQFFFDTSWGMG
jgi:hypothetical protein